MNRLEEYKEMKEMLEPIPPSQCVQKAVRRRRRNRAIGKTCGGIAAVFCLFVGAINLSPAAAAACREIPLLQELADLLLFRPSIRMAVAHDYLQVVDQGQTKNEITARVEYLVVDQKQVNLYYRLQSDCYEALSATPEVLDAEGHRISAGGGICEEQDDLQEITIDFVEETVPDTMTLVLRVYDNGSSRETEPVDEDEDWEPEEPETLAEFSFPLHFDPYYTAQGKQVELHKTVELDGQKLTVTGMEVYPSHIRINVEEDPANTAQIATLRFYLELENGKKIDLVRDGISATGTIENPYATSYRAESSYFENAEVIRMKITGADFLDLDREVVSVDLNTLEHDPLPEGIQLREAQRTADGWKLSFGIRKQEGRAQLLNDYEDPAGQRYSINRYSSTVELSDANGNPIPGWKEETYYLDELPGDNVILHLRYNRGWTPEEPVAVELQEG